MSRISGKQPRQAATQQNSAKADDNEFAFASSAEYRAQDKQGQRISNEMFIGRVQKRSEYDAWQAARLARNYPVSIQLSVQHQIVHDKNHPANGDQRND